MPQGCSSFINLALKSEKVFETQNIMCMKANGTLDEITYHWNQPIVLQ
jgi:hypothetical protein